MAMSVEFQRVARVGTALETRNHIIHGCQNIHYFSFAFIAPLQAEQNVHFHIFSLSKNGAKIQFFGEIG